MRKYELTKEQVQELPVEVIQEVEKVLKCFDEANITYEYGKYEVSPHIAILAKYAPDHKYIGYIKVETYYTLEERKKNFKETFGYDM